MPPTDDDQRVTPTWRKPHSTKPYMIDPDAWSRLADALRHTAQLPGCRIDTGSGTP